MDAVRVGIAGYETMKARSLRIARGEEKPGPDDPKLWFVSEEAAQRELENPALLRAITGTT